MKDATGSAGRAQLTFERTPERPHTTFVRPAADLREAEPATIDIEFVEGPEAGNTALGIFAFAGDQLMICLGLVGSDRPKAFKTKKGSGHALERLHRASRARPASVTGGKKPTASPEAPAANVDRKSNGEPMNEQWLAFGSRITTGNETKVVFGGQTIVHARMRSGRTLSLWKRR